MNPRVRMGDAAIRAAGLGKRYRIGAKPQYLTLRESVGRAATWPARAVRSWVRDDSPHAAPPTIWAIKDLSFDIGRGETVGIIGPNGAGKSTLLKILSRITVPTTGYADIAGRVQSLLEVGTGFHPELTGRENIYINGAILGMRRTEIDRKLERIVAFAEIAPFLDTPIKHYSSGMQMRLAFSVAAHLDPDILLVDEVLAVGDAAFQRKCLGKMNEIAHEGRTILFVSHNTAAIEALCDTCLWLQNGRLLRYGPTSTVVQAYLGEVLNSSDPTLNTDRIRTDGSITVRAFQVLNCHGRPAPLPATNEDMSVRVELAVERPIPAPVFVFSARNEHGTLMFSVNTAETGEAIEPLRPGPSVLTIRLRKVPLLPGRFVATLQIMNRQRHRYLRADDAFAFELRQSPLYGTQELDHKWGCVYLDTHMSVESFEAATTPAPIKD